MFRSYSVCDRRCLFLFDVECTCICRLFLSGSSALPESTFQKWRDLTGFEIVEQFGSSETGRVLSNKLDGKKLAGKQRSLIMEQKEILFPLGRVGLPMPDLKVRLVQKDENDNDVTVAEGTYDEVKILEKGLLRNFTSDRM